MDNAEFKKIVRKKLTEAGFVYRNKNYYYHTEDLIVIIDLQKSNFSDGWYINFGFYVKAVHDDKNDYPKPSERDIFGRFLKNTPSEMRDVFELTMSQDEMEVAIQDELNEKIIPVLENGIEEYFNLFPYAKKIARGKLKDYLGIEY